MKKDINFILIGLLLLALISIAGMAVYYDGTYKDLNVQYTEAANEIRASADELNKTICEVNAKNDELDKKEKVLRDIIDELNLSEQKFSSLGDLFTDVRGDKEELEVELTETVTEREQWKSDYTGIKLQLGVCETDYAIAKSKVVQLEDTKNRMKTYTTDADLKLAAISRKLDDANEYLDIMSGDIDNVENNTMRDLLEDDLNDVDDRLTLMENRISELNDILLEMKSRLERDI